MARKKDANAAAVEAKPSKRETVFKWIGKIAAYVGLSSIIALPFHTYLMAKAAALFSKQHVIKGLWTEWQPPVPSCTAWNMTFIPKGSITHLDVFIHFAQEYHAVLVRPVRPNLTGAEPRLIPGQVAITDSCDFAEPSMPNSPNFSVIPYNNRTDITVKGFDLEPADTYTVVVLFHPDYMIGSTGWGGHTNTATYTAYGQEVPARFESRNPPPNFDPTTDDDLPPIPSEFDKQK